VATSLPKNRDHADFAGLWKQKLQTEIALSTMEAEYIALSLSMRELIPICALVQGMATAMNYTKELNICAHSKVFEDNNGALTLAKAPSMTPRSKNIAVKYHFFREYIVNGSIQIHRIDTKFQKADIFTKGLLKDAFENIRKLLMGW
jgi:hypothetical protein